MSKTLVDRVNEALDLQESDVELNAFEIEEGDVVMVDDQPGTVVEIQEEEGIVIVEFEDGEVAEVEMDDVEICDEDEVSEAAQHMVKAGVKVVGGKIVKVKAHRTRKLSPDQLRAIKAAARKRKGKRVKASTLKARAKSMKMRKRFDK